MTAIENGADERTRASMHTALRLLLQPQFRNVVFIGRALVLVTVSDSLLYLTLQRRLALSTGFFPLLFVITAFIYMVLAIPVGQLADRLGHKLVFIGGYAILALVYLLLLLSVNAYAAAGGMLLLGLYYAATDGVLMALASGLLPRPGTRNGSRPAYHRHRCRAAIGLYALRCGLELGWSRTSIDGLYWWHGRCIGGGGDRYQARGH